MPHLRLGRMQSGDCRMYVTEYPACIATVSGHHQSDVFWSDETSTATVIPLFFRDTTWLSYFQSLFYLLLGMSPVCPLRSIFLLHTMLSMILFFQLFLKSDLDFGKSKILYWKIITSLIALNHRSSCWILVLSCHWRGAGQEGAEKKVSCKRPFCFITNIEQNRNCSRFS